MWKWLKNAKERVGIPSGRAIVHIVVVQLIIQLGWNWLSRMFTIPWIREVGFLVLFIAALFAVAWYLPKLSPRLSGSSVKKIETEQEPSGISKYNQQYADWMTAALNRDENNFPRCIFVHNMTINWLPLRETDSYFLIHYDVYSSSVFRLDIGKKVDGHLRYGSEPMERIIEVLSPIEQLERSTTQHITLRQWVSDSRMNRIALDGGKEINLIFSDINIWVEAKLPDGSEGPKFRLPIPNKWKVKMPTRVELEG